MKFLSRPPEFTLEEAQGLAQRTIEQFNIDPTNGAAIFSLDEGTKAQLAEWLVTIAFEKLKRKKSTNEKLFDSTVQKVLSTKALEAASFSQWKGYQSLTRKLMQVERDGRHPVSCDFDSFWMIDAPTLLAAWIVKNIRRVRSTENECATEYLIQFNIWTYIDVAMDVHDLIEWGRALGGVFRIDMDPTCKLMRAEKVGRLWVVTIPPLTHPNDSLEEVEIHRRAIARVESEPEPQLSHGIEKTRTVTLRREEALKGAEAFLPKLGIWKHNSDLIEPIKAWLTESIFKVLPQDTKNKLACWCNQFWPEFPINDEDMDADLSEIEVTETYIEPREPLLTNTLDTPMTDHIKRIGHWIEQASGGQECGQALINIAHNLDGIHDQMRRRVIQAQELNAQMASVYQERFEQLHETVNRQQEKMSDTQEQLSKGVQAMVRCAEALRVQMSGVEVRQSADLRQGLPSVDGSSRPLKRPRTVKGDGESVDLVANFETVFAHMTGDEGRLACWKLAEALLEEPQLLKLDLAMQVPKWGEHYTVMKDREAIQTEI